MNKPVQRKFMIGDDWLYYKIYSGPGFLDKLLVNELYPVLLQLKKDGIIDKFFFIRYRDPQYHIRLRIRLTDTEIISPVIQKLKVCLSPYLQNRMIWNISSEVYKREIERYGERTIDIVESIFYDNSLSVLSFLEQAIQEDDDKRWEWGLHYMDTLLDSLDYSVEGKAELSKIFFTNFSNEFDLNKFSREKLSAKYRLDAPKIERTIQAPVKCPYFILNNESVSGINSYPALKEKEILGSLLHMHFNRLFRNKQRAYEFLIYHHLDKYYKSMIARKKQASSIL